MITNKYKDQFRKELTEFIKNYETRPTFADAVRKVQGLNDWSQDLQGLADWYRDLDRQNLTSEAVDAMARDYDNQTISEGRVYVSNNPNYKE